MEVVWLAEVPYAPMLAQQELRHAQVAAGQAPEALFLLEHPPTVTTGRNGKAENLLRTPAQLAAMGVDYVVTGRGGDVTYHGPGQLVGYPILALQEGERDLRRYVDSLEEVLIRTAADFGVRAERQAGLRGIWVGNNKLAAIGVRLAQWVTMHGFALNVATDLTGFDLMVPCGLHGRGVTSLAQLCNPVPSLADVRARLVAHAEAVWKRPAIAALLRREA